MIFQYSIRESDITTVLVWLETDLAGMLGLILLAIFGIALVLRNHIQASKMATAQSLSLDAELLTDKEQVVMLLHANGGQMKQSEIVESVEWSKSKVSRLLSELEEDDEITKLRLGRENLIFLPDDAPAAANSSDWDVDIF